MTTPFLVIRWLSPRYLLGRPGRRLIRVHDRRYNLQVIGACLLVGRLAIWIYWRRRPA